MSFIPKPYEIYKHFKGNLYQIVAVAQHSETGEQLVVYQALYGDFKIYARPLDMFVSRVDKEKYPDALQEHRFELQVPESGDFCEHRTETEPDNAGSSAGHETEAAQNIADKSLSAEDFLISEPSEELNLDPMVLEFLDADSYEQRINILTGLHHRITDDMITVMAIASDVEVGEGDTEERYVSLRNCLLTLERYECNRLK